MTTRPDPYDCIDAYVDRLLLLHPEKAREVECDETFCDEILPAYFSRCERRAEEERLGLWREVDDA